MKELSIEEKAKAYDEAIKRAKAMIPVAANQEEIYNSVITIFPELKESEDERIRKDIISHFAKGIEGSSFDEVREKYKIWIAWLEKKGKNNMGISEDTKQKLEDNLNKALGKETPESLDKFLDKQGKQKPADVRTTDYWNFEDIEQKTAWSEEELDSITAAINNLEYLKNNYVYHPMGLEPAITFLKSLKERIVPQTKQEWSEEDKAILEKCIGAVKVSCYSHSFKSEAENWLKSLRPQSQWKPSDEQMEALWDSIPENVKEISEREMLLDSLYQDLKKLRG